MMATPRMNEIAPVTRRNLFIVQNSPEQEN
jgi:hypothetical protein